MTITKEQQDAINKLTSKQAKEKLKIAKLMARFTRELDLRDAATTRRNWSGAGTATWQKEDERRIKRDDNMTRIFNEIAEIVGAEKWPEY